MAYYTRYYTRSPAMRLNMPAKVKPKKPYPDFPLFPHAAGLWAKKIKGQLHYFGPWADPDRALQKYLDQRDDLQAGRKPRGNREGLTLRDLLNRFLTVKQARVESGELTQRSFNDYFATCQRVGSQFGLDRLVVDLAADDFEGLRQTFTKVGWGPSTVSNEVQRARVLFKFAFDAGLIPAPVRYGAAFKRPSAKVMRKQRAAKGPNMFEAAEIQKLLAGASVPLKAMLLLGLNCGFGNSDCAALPRAALDLKNGWLDFPRPKTGINRRCPLWPETVKALRAAIKVRPAAKDQADAGLAFITKYGHRWVHPTTTDNTLSKEFAKLMRETKLQRKKKPAGVRDRNFYALRHTFQTIAGEARDPDAVRFLMGHVDPTMSDRYRERISDARLLAVVDTVRRWLWPESDA